MKQTWYFLYYPSFVDINKYSSCIPHILVFFSFNPSKLNLKSTDMVNSPLFWSLAMYHANWARWICIYHTCCKNKGDPLPEGFRLPLLGCMFPIWPNSYHSLWPVWTLLFYISHHLLTTCIYAPSSPFSLSTDNTYIVHACMHVWSLLTFLSLHIFWQHLCLYFHALLYSSMFV